MLISPPAQNPLVACRWPKQLLMLQHRRISTPDYGGPDVQRRSEQPAEVIVADDGRSVDLVFDELRTGFVYEFHLRNLATSDSGQAATFFPAEAYYTLHKVPE